MADLYKIKVNQKDLLAACENYLHHRHHKATRRAIVRAAAEIGKEMK